MSGDRDIPADYLSKITLDPGFNELLIMNRILLLILISFLCACGNSPDENPMPSDAAGKRMEQKRNRHRGGHNFPEIPAIKYHDDTVLIPGNSPVNGKLSLLTTGATEPNARFATTGVVRPLPGHMAEIASPFEGRLIKSFVTLGQKVSTGTPLFEISSSDYLETVRMYLQAKREKEMAEKNYTRKKELLEAGIVSSKDFEEARLAFDLAEKELEKTAAILQIFNIDTENPDLAKPLIMRSPIAGEVVRADITPGQYIKADSDPIVTVSNLGRVSVVAHVREKDLGSISLKDKVEVCTESRKNNPFSGEITYIGSMMNEQTRSVDVFIECENREASLKSGMFVTVWFYHNEEEAIIIPASSLLQDEDMCFLFVQVSPGTFVKRRVEVTSVPDLKLRVDSGISAGEIIVTEGGIYLR